MPEQVIDWAGIRTAVGMGMSIRAAARHAAQGLPDIEQARFVARVLKRADREGWTVANSALAAAIAPQGKAMSSKVFSGAEIASSLAQEVKEKSKAALAKGVLLMAEDAANLPPGTALEHAPLVLAATKSFTALYPEQSQPSTVLNVAFIQQAG